MFGEDILNYNKAYLSFDLDHLELDPVELSINNESSALEYRYYEEFDEGHYMCKKNYAFNKITGFVTEDFEHRFTNTRNIITRQREVIWFTTDTSQYAFQITVKLNNIYKNNKSITLHLVNGDVKRLGWINGKWVENSRTELDITKGWESKEYKITGDGRIRNFQTSEGFVFKKIVQSHWLFFDDEKVIWEAGSDLECSRSVSMFSGDKGSKYLAVLMANNDYQLFYKANNKKPWKNITRKRLTKNIFRRHKIEKTIVKNLEDGLYETVIYDMYYIVRLLRNTKGRIGFNIYPDQANCDYYYTNLMTNRVVVTHNGMFLEVDPKRSIYTTRSYDLEYYNESDYDKSFSPDSGNDRVFDPFFCYKNNSFKTKSVAISDVKKRFFSPNAKKIANPIPKLQNITTNQENPRDVIRSNSQPITNSSVNRSNSHPNTSEINRSKSTVNTGEFSNSTVNAVELSNSSVNNGELSNSSINSVEKSTGELKGIMLDIGSEEGESYNYYREDEFVQFDCKKGYKFDRVILCESLYIDPQVIWEQNDPLEIVTHVSFLHSSEQYLLLFSSYYRYRLFKCSSDRTWEDITESSIKMSKFIFYGAGERVIYPSEVSVDLFKFQFEVKINCYKVVYDKGKISKTCEMNRKIKRIVVKLLENRVDIFYTEKFVQRLLVKDNKVQISIHDVCDHYSHHKPTLTHS
ncbi:hypothetical protein TpMuguga_04g00255 [Theileria parva strain Muguga]|uniref:Uncharacterized protein n=1 Tax=Theileria parva TaxID=5875 RepID=Q4N2U1_THEPA|nr:uncharacterized protein TpMuguga_04g00255 [Theileria parva strain Muguga]EAN31607.1 hypothetical protein TpMuguga_04g00255 [Theileria parva strain Muguga]|eukprot:XP_763890.1 hypothetical protein [Theileria parva strain Muguga]